MHRAHRPRCRAPIAAALHATGRPGGTAGGHRPRCAWAAASDGTGRLVGVAGHPDGLVDVGHRGPARRLVPHGPRRDARRRLDAVRPRPGDASRSFGSTRTSMVGLSAWAVMDARGQSLDSGLDLPAGLDPSLEQTLQGSIDAAQTASPPLPVEAVGVGARWRTLANVPSASLPDACSDERRVHPRAGLGDGIVLRSTAPSMLQPGPLALPGVPAGTTARAARVSGTVARDDRHRPAHPWARRRRRLDQSHRRAGDQRRWHGRCDRRPGGRPAHRHRALKPTVRPADSR